MKDAVNRHIFKAIIYSEEDAVIAYPQPIALHTREFFNLRPAWFRSQKLNALKDPLAMSFRDRAQIFFNVLTVGELIQGRVGLDEMFLLQPRNEFIMRNSFASCENGFLQSGSIGSIFNKAQKPLIFGHREHNGLRFPTVINKKMVRDWLK